jgi:hypothetical protein
MAKPSNPGVAKSSNPQVAKSPEKPKAKKTKTAVSLTDVAIRRLDAACADHRLDQSDIIEWLINANLSGYIIQVRGPRLAIGQSEVQVNRSAPVTPDDRLEADDSVSHVETVAA